MSTALIIVIAVAAIVVIALIAAMVRRRNAEREIEQHRLSGEALAHRDQADSNVAKAQERGHEAELHRRQASEHAVRAEEHAAAASEHAEKATGLEREIQTAGQAAAFHDDQAAEREDKLAQG
jgi:ABC-type lipoprotein release transport system permease subunit